MSGFGDGEYGTALYGGPHGLSGLEGDLTLEGELDSRLRRVTEPDPGFLPLLSLSLDILVFSDLTLEGSLPITGEISTEIDSEPILEGELPLPGQINAQVEEPGTILLSLVGELKFSQEDFPVVMLRLGTRPSGLLRFESDSLSLSEVYDTRADGLLKLISPDLNTKVASINEMSGLLRLVGGLTPSLVRTTELETGVLRFESEGLSTVNGGLDPLVVELDGILRFRGWNYIAQGHAIELGGELLLEGSIETETHETTVYIISLDGELPFSGEIESRTKRRRKVHTRSYHRQAR